MKLAKIFTDYMILQAEKAVRFFGTGKGKVEISFLGKSRSEKFFGDFWLLEFPPERHGVACDVTISLNEKIITLKNVVFGDVFLCAGQSNMQFLFGSETGDKRVIADDLIRYFASDAVEKGWLGSDAGWRLCNEKETDRWSALGYHIAEYYKKEKGVPIGIVCAAQGASVIRSWLPARALDKNVFVPLEKRHGDSSAKEWSAWNGDSVLYEKTFCPITPFSFKAVVWYQGESDTTEEESKVYTELLKRLVTEWRKDLKDEGLPFVVVEICDFDQRSDDGWRAIQRCQSEIVGKICGVCVVTSSDVCEHNDIHPSDKRKLAEKVARAICLQKVRS